MSTQLAGQAAARAAGSPVFAAGRAAPGGDGRARAGGNQRGCARSDETGRFREDLYYRLNVLSINVPPLRERTAEIPLLFRHFLGKYSEKFGKTPPGALEVLAGCRSELSLARELAGIGEFRKALRDSRGRRRQPARIGGDVLDAPTHFAAGGTRTAQGSRGLKALVRGLKDEAEMEAIADALEKTRWCRKGRRKDAGDQLQGAALQNAAVQPGYAADEESSSHDGGSRAGFGGRDAARLRALVRPEQFRQRESI